MKQEEQNKREERVREAQKRYEREKGKLRETCKQLVINLKGWNPRFPDPRAEFIIYLDDEDNGTPTLSGYLLELKDWEKIDEYINWLIEDGKFENIYLDMR